MVKSTKILKECRTSVIKIGSSLYMLIPFDMIQDTSFPLSKLKNIKDHVHHDILKLKMLKDKLIIGEK